MLIRVHADFVPDREAYLLIQEVVEDGLRELFGDGSASLHVDQYMCFEVVKLLIIRLRPVPDVSLNHRQDDTLAGH